MGLHSERPSNITYLSIIGGKLAQRFKSNAEGLTARDILDDKGNVVKTVYEKYYDKIDGSLTKAFLKESPYGHDLVFVITDDGQNYQLSIPMSSGYGRSILFRIPNIDVDRKITFSPYSFHDNEKDKNVSGVSIYQEGCGWDKDKVPPFWTKDDQKKLPELEVKVVLGKKKYDDSARTEYLANTFIRWAKTVDSAVSSDEVEAEAVSPMEMEAEFAKETTKKEPAPQLDEEEDDDLPF